MQTRINYENLNLISSKLLVFKPVKFTFLLLGFNLIRSDEIFVEAMIKNFDVQTLKA